MHVIAKTKSAHQTLNWVSFEWTRTSRQYLRGNIRHLLALASCLGVVVVNMDRFLAVHLHLRYQELMTHKRVVYMVISIWVYITFVSSMTLWGLRGTPNAFSSVTVAIGFILTFAFYIKIYLTVWRHKNQIQSVRIREEAQSDKMKKFAALIKSTIIIF